MEHYSEGIEYDENLLKRLVMQFFADLDAYREKLERLEEYERNRGHQKRAA